MKTQISQFLPTGFNSEVGILDEIIDIDNNKKIFKTLKPGYVMILNAFLSFISILCIVFWVKTLVNKEFVNTTMKESYYFLLILLYFILMIKIILYFLVNLHKARKYYIRSVEKKNTIQIIKDILFGVGSVIGKGILIILGLVIYFSIIYTLTDIMVKILFLILFSIGIAYQIYKLFSFINSCLIEKNSKRKKAFIFQSIRVSFMLLLLVSAVIIYIIMLLNNNKLFEIIGRVLKGSTKV